MIRLNAQTSAPTVRRCPRGSLDDVQLESVLSPVMFRRGPRPTLWTASPDDAMPDLGVLHLGGDWQRLVAGLLCYPLHLTAKIGYVGVDLPLAEGETPDGSRDAGNGGSGNGGSEGALPAPEGESALRLSEDRELPESRLKSLELLSWEQLQERRGGGDGEGGFDYVLLANVLHHVAPASLPDLFATLLKLMRPGAFLVVHDLYLAAFEGPVAVSRSRDLSRSCDLSKYCPEGIFFSPRHLASFFALAASDTGLYRILPRSSPAGRWWRFTSVLRTGGGGEGAAEASPGAASGAAEVFTHEYMPAGIALSLEEMLEQALQLHEAAWRDAYVERLAQALEEVRSRWHLQLRDPVPRFAARRWLGRGDGQVPV